MSDIRALFERKRAQAAAELAEAERRAAEEGKQKFDYAVFCQLLRSSDGRGTEAEHRTRYYVSHPEILTMMEYVRFVESIEPWEDSR
jgi:hypothetical protein